jgi:hypothetical protein
LSLKCEACGDWPANLEKSESPLPDLNPAKLTTIWHEVLPLHHFDRSVPRMSVQLTIEQAAFLQGPVSMNIGAVGLDGWPCVCRANGALVSRNRRSVTVLLSSVRGRAVLEALDAGSGVSVVFSRPATHMTLQIKAGGAMRVAVNSACRAVNASYAAMFGKELASLGYGEDLVQGLIQMVSTRDLVALRIAPDIVFDQTPGPNAGRVLARA